MSEHKHGEMDITAQEAAFEGFMAWTKRVTILCIVILLFLAVFNS